MTKVIHYYDKNYHTQTLTGSRSIHDFAPISVLAPGATASTTLGVDFADTIQPIEFTIMSSLGNNNFIYYKLGLILKF